MVGQDKAGFETKFSDGRYAVLYRDGISIAALGINGHARAQIVTRSRRVQLLRVDVKNVKPLFDELIQRGTFTSEDASQANTPWNTNEFGFFDLNRKIALLSPKVEGGVE